MAIRLAERLNQLLDRGGFVSTYKYAVLIALIDLCMEYTTSEGMPPEIVTTRQLAMKVIELYWPQTAPFEDRGVLRQNSSERRTDDGKVHKPAQILRDIGAFREEIRGDTAASLSLEQAKARAGSEVYSRLVDQVEWKLIEYPLPRLQIIGREEDRFLFEYGFDKKVSKRVVDRYQIDPESPWIGEGAFDNRLRLKDGVGASLIALSGVLRPLIHRSWALMVAGFNRIEIASLEGFLFGEERISLDPVRPGLTDIQEGRCFYCRRGLSGKTHVDHFIPWSRHADNSLDNLVVAHERCNLSKKDFLAAADHVERWRERSRDHERDLASLAKDKTWESRPSRTFSVARAIYGGLPDDIRLWLNGTSFVLIDPPRIAGALSPWR